MQLCPYCGHKNDSKAVACSLCKRSLASYKKRWLKWGMLIVLSVFLLGIIWAINFFGKKADMKKENVQIQILSSAGYRTRKSYMVTEGKILNVHSGNLTGVHVIVTWYNQAKKVISRQREKITPDNLASYGTANFIVKTPYHVEMNNYDIAFELADCTVLLSQDLSNKAQENVAVPEKK